MSSLTTPPPTTWITEFFGDKLLTKPTSEAAEEVCVTKALSKVDYIGIYFSAHWCPPCRSFTPVLVETYKKIKAKEGCSFEIIFASSDGDQSSFDEYYGEMPWAALPYSERKVKEELSERFKVSGIPTFVILDSKTGEVINEEGRKAVLGDPEGSLFPWKPKTWGELITGAPDLLCGNAKDGYEKLDFADHIKGKKVVFYFDQGDENQDFTEKVVELYEQTKKASSKEHDDYEVIFVYPETLTQKDFDVCFAGMPWSALPCNCDHLNSIRAQYGWDGSSCQVTVVDGDTGEVLNEDACDEVHEGAEHKNYFWEDRYMYDIEEMQVGVESAPTLFLLYQNVAQDATEERKRLFDVMMSVAKVEKKDKERVVVNYFVSGGGRANKALQDICPKVKAEKEKVQLVILDLSDEGAYYVEEVSDPSQIDEKRIREFMGKFKDKELSREQCTM